MVWYTDAPTCRECGSIALTRDGKVTCANCGYVAGTALAVMRMRATHDNHGAALLALAEARDEGHAAGRAEALEEAAAQCDAQNSLLFDLGTDSTGAQRCATAIRALAGKP